MRRQKSQETSVVTEALHQRMQREVIVRVSQSTWRDAGRCSVGGDGNMEFSSASGS